MNSAHLVQQGSTMWQGVLKAWSTLQTGMEQLDPQSWAEIARQPIFGNRLLTNEKKIQWGTEPRSNLKWWFEKNVRTLQDITRSDGRGWKTFTKLRCLRQTSVTPALYARVVNNIPWTTNILPPHHKGQWIAPKEDDGSIQQVFHIQNTIPMEAKVYTKQGSEQLSFVGQQQIHPTRLMREVRILRCSGEKRIVIDFNPYEEIEPNQSLWLWGNDWIINLAWDPREWQWRRIGILLGTSVMNYSTKRGYRIALKQNTQQMNLDLELEHEGYNNQARAKKINRIWHPYLPRKVSAMQWLVLTEGLPVEAWRVRIGLPSACELCVDAVKETLQHALQDYPQVNQVWTLFRNTRRVAGLEPSYLSWRDISSGLMCEPSGPRIKEELRWDTASKFILNAETPWDILRAQLLWSIWCQRVAHKFKDEIFHIGLVLWHAWRNTIYCAMEAYKELFRYKRNEEKRQEAISCFQQIWTMKTYLADCTTTSSGTSLHPQSSNLRSWQLGPHRLLVSGALSPSPDPEADFVARPDFANLVDEFLRSAEEAVLPAQAEPDTASQTGEADFVTGSDVATTEDESLRSVEEGVLPAHPDPYNTTQQADTSDSSTFTQQEAPANLPHRTSSEVATKFSKEWASTNPGTLETPLAPYHHSTITHQQDTTHQVISPPALVLPPKCIHISQDDPKDSGIPVSDTSNEKDGRHDSSSRQSKTPDRVVITHTNRPHTYTGQVSNLEGKSTRQEVRERVTPERCPNSDRPPRSRLK